VQNDDKTSIVQGPEDRAYPLRHGFDDDDDDIDEGGEWVLGRRRPLRSRSAGGRTSAKRRRQRQKGRRTGGKDGVVAGKERRRRLLNRIIEIVSHGGTRPEALNIGRPEMQQNRKLNNYDRTDL